MTAPATALAPHVPPLANTTPPPPTAAAAIVFAPPHASHHQIHMLATPSRLDVGADAPSLHLPVVPKGSSVDSFGVAGDTAGNKGSTVEGAGDANP